MSPIIRPWLALQGYDALQARWVDSEIDDARASNREMLDAAGPHLRPDRLVADPRGGLLAVLDAISGSDWLGPRRAEEARRWVLGRTPEEVGGAVSDLLYGEAPLEERVARFLGIAGAGSDESDATATGFGAAATSTLLALSDPSRYGPTLDAHDFAAAHPLLCVPAGQDGLDIDRVRRVALASALYAEVRDLWARERGFAGDLLDVQARLYWLGGGADDGDNACPWLWSAALTPAQLAALAAEAEAARPEWRTAAEAASALMRERFMDLDRPEDPLHGLTLTKYAYGVGPGTFVRAVEFDTQEFVRATAGNASAHGVGRAKDGTWRIRAKVGHTEQEAEAAFQDDVLPRLRSLAEAARRMMAGERASAVIDPASEKAPYRSIDAKAFLLFAAGYDPDRTRTDLVAVLNPERLRALGRLLGTGDLLVRTFGDYLRACLAVRNALAPLRAGSDLPTSFGLGGFAYGTSPGRVLLALAEGKYPLDEGVDDEYQEGDDEEEDDGEGGGRAPAGEGAEPPSPAPCTHPLNVVLYGPPGTGKTYTARLRALEIVEGEPR